MLITGGVVAGALVLAFALSTWADIRVYRQEAREAGLLTARVVASYTVADLAFRDQQAATESLDALETIPTLEAAFLYDLQGDLFASFGERKPPPEIPDRWAGPRIRDGRLEVVEPVVQKGRTYGTLYLRFSTEELWDRIRRDLLLSLLILGAVVVASLLVAVRLQRVVSDPILDLARTARKISLSGD
ncbi:MAG: CHASE sensor domain-containing protein, partial [Thermoanaerobaculia bacterium]|nr:CHASE sensor domain-containing protein [Thermoanaerobaculia bacterium]